MEINASLYARRRRANWIGLTLSMSAMALGLFSFAKFLMWKDLVERTDALRHNRVVKHLIDTPEQAFSGEGGAFIEECELDRSYAPADIVSLLPADSSQIAASASTRVSMSAAL